MLEKFIIVAVGGGFGSVCRFIASIFASNLRFPAATFTVNILGSFIIGLAYAYFGAHSNVSANAKLLLMTGFCGGFTTFSAFSLESMNFIENGNYFFLFLYVFSSVIFGIGAVFLGYCLLK
jgi:CrcB protein